MMSIPLDSFVPVLVEMMTMEYMPDIMLLAARALTTMADVIPPSRGAIVHHGRVAAVLLAFAHHRVHRSRGTVAASVGEIKSRLRRGVRAAGCPDGLSLVPGLFLSRHAARELANRRQHLSTASELHFRRRHGRRAHPGQSLGARRSASRGLFVRVLDQSGDQDGQGLLERVVALCQSGLVGKVMDLISASSNRTVSPLTHHALIKLLNVCTKHNPDVALELLRGNLPETLSVALSRCKVLTTASAGPSSASPASSGVASPIMTSDQLLEVATLADALLPTVNSKSRSAKKEQSPCSQNVPVLTTREPALLVNYATNLINVLMQAVDSSVPQSVKVKCLSALTKWTQLSSEQSFKTIVETTPLAAFCATQLSSREARQIEGCLDLVEFGMEKKTLDMARILRKEGAVHALKQLFGENDRLDNAMDAAEPLHVARRGCHEDSGRTRAGARRRIKRYGRA